MEGNTTLRAVLTLPKIYLNLMGRDNAGTYESGRPRQVWPGFDETGRWFVGMSGTAAEGQVYAIDCSREAPTVHKIGGPGTRAPFVVIDGATLLLATNAGAGPGQLAVWDLSGERPRVSARLDIGWTEYLDPSMGAGGVSLEGCGNGGGAGKGWGRSEVWRYGDSGKGRRIGSIRTEEWATSSGENRFIGGSEGVFDIRTGESVRLNGYVPHPKTYRDAHPSINTHFEYLISPDGHWAVGRRYMLEGYPEFSRKFHYSWRWVFDLRSATPERPVIEMPKIQECILQILAVTPRTG